MNGKGSSLSHTKVMEAFLGKSNTRYENEG
jgi:hypothetical protein